METERSSTSMLVSKVPKNRVAVVTGANKGIGFFIALQLGCSQMFSDIIVACRDPLKGRLAEEQIQPQLPSGVQASFEPLTVGDEKSHDTFVRKLEDRFGKLDVLVNNAGIAFKAADPTPFKEQSTPTLNVNYHGTVDLTNKLLPLLDQGTDPRIVTVASVAGYLNQIPDDELRMKFLSPSLNFPYLNMLVDMFEADVQAGIHAQRGWGNSNYGMSKLALIAATRIWAKQNPSITVNCCCPGFCRTDMSSHRGDRSPEEGARNAVIPATMENPPTGEFFSNFKVAKW